MVFVSGLASGFRAFKPVAPITIKGIVTLVIVLCVFVRSLVGRLTILVMLIVVMLIIVIVVIVVIVMSVIVGIVTSGLIIVLIVTNPALGVALIIRTFHHHLLQLLLLLPLLATLLATLLVFLSLFPRLPLAPLPFLAPLIVVPRSGRAF